MYVEEQEAIPWDTLNVMVADITYGVSRHCTFKLNQRQEFALCEVGLMGLPCAYPPVVWSQGRVTDKQDKRSIGSIMRKYFDPQVSLATTL